MGRKDTITKQYLARPDIFADAFNYYLFGGRPVIRPDDLNEQDPTELTVVRRAERLLTDQKMRDVLKLCNIRHSKYATFVLLGIESQDKANYVMPVRDMLYDALNYSSQVQKIKRQHMEAGDLKTGAEFMSGFSKSDTLIPVITLCVCFDKEKWEAPRSLHEMFGDMDPQIRPYINDYSLHLITPCEINDYGKFSSGLGLVLEFILNSNDKKQMYSIIESREAYQSVDTDTVDIINLYTDAGISKKQAEGGQVNMCTAIQELIEDGRIEGRAEGLAEGENMIISLLKLLEPGSKEYDKALNGSAADRKKLYKKYKIIE
ncbi:MAG: transposase [Lachnospiraceae bacterium]|nr:transposase [Lachnospiraceae bacterium]